MTEKKKKSIIELFSKFKSIHTEPLDLKPHVYQKFYEQLKGHFKVSMKIEKIK